MGKEQLAQEWLKRWGKGKMQAFQDAFARAFGISLCLITTEGEPLTVWSNSSLFCHYMLKNNRQRCLQERSNAIRQCLETGRLSFSRCYMGLTYFFQPVLCDRKIVCLFYGGGFCSEDDFNTRAGNLEGKVPVFQKKQIEIMLNLLEEIINLSNPAEIRGANERADQDISLLQQKLSSREVQIVHLIISGLSNKEIGEQLFISEKTVKTHVSNILTKMGMKDRMQLMIFCRQHNIN